MKLTILALLSTLACACASAPARQPVAINRADYQPPTNMEMVWNQKVEADNQQTEVQKAAHEEQTYNDSVTKIEGQLQDERLQILMCTEVHGVQGKECWSLLGRFCEIDTVLDSRSGHHTKEYCNQTFLDWHNPAKKH